jgi:signal transduction histidine kinase
LKQDPFLQKNIRISTIGLALVIAMVSAGGLLGAGSLLTVANISDIQTTWDKFQATRSDKAAALNVLRRELGYGGMIHQFKNFVLRQDRTLVDIVNAKIGGVNSAIAHYRALNLNDKERESLDSIQRMVQDYTHSLALADDLVQLGQTTKNIDHRVKVDDTAAIAALDQLETEISAAREIKNNEITKSEAVAGLRKALGYGGMIHNFKNMILRNDPNYLDLTHLDISYALKDIDLYRQRPLNPAEQAALKTITDTINAYSNALGRIKELSLRKERPRGIDAQVRIDDEPALRAFDTLTREIAFQNEQEAKKVDHALSLVNEVSKTVAVSIFAVTLVLSLAVLWVSRTQIITPIQLMTADMTRLASGDLDFEVNRSGHTKEIGEMAQAVEIFRKTAQERNAADKALRETTDRLESSQQIAHVGSWDWDITTGDLQWTDEIYSIFDRTPDTFAATYENFLICIVEEDRSAVIAAVDEAVMKDIPYDIEHRVLRLDGTIRYVHEAGLVYRDDGGRPVRMLGVVHDVTERTLVEKAKAEFTATVSHELRTPLTSIKGALGLIRGGATGEISEKAKAMIDIAYRNSDRLLLLINDILDIEKMSSGKLTFTMEPMDIDALVDEALISNKSFGDEHDVTFTKTQSHPNAIVLGDKNRLMQVLSNLISNGAKYSPPGAQLELSVLGLNDIYRISVKDSGSGIPANFQEHIFEKFSQADSSDTRNKSGTGLGLSITKAIVERHGGAIGFESEPGHGATFYFDLPKSLA